MSHVHRACEVTLRSKQDSVVITCDCGKRDIVGVWYHKPLPGWSKRQWPKLLQAINLFLDSYLTSTGVKL